MLRVGLGSHRPRPPRRVGNPGAVRRYDGGVTFRLYDTATRAIRDFAPREAGRAGIYLCGLTVQSEPHVGHVRSAVNFDVLARWLTARGYDVTMIRNITDIDDKILTKAAEQGRPWYNLAYAMRHELDAAYDALNVALPTYEPAATGHVPEMLELIERLISRGHAYAAEDGSGDVYFDVRSWPTTARSPASGSTTWRPPRTPTRAASVTPATSRCGRAGSRTPSPRPPRGPRRGGGAGPAGTSSAPRWR